MKKGMIIGIIAAVLAIGIGVVWSSSRTVLCSSVTMLDNKSKDSLMEYNGYYVHEEIVYNVLKEHKSEVDKLCTGTFKEKYKDGGNIYVIFKDSNTGKQSAIVIQNQDGREQVMACEDVRYMITYTKGSKGDCSWFDYNIDTAVTF